MLFVDYILTYILLKEYLVGKYKIRCEYIENLALRTFLQNGYINILLDFSGNEYT